jgi:hypothetical protein
MASGKSSFNVDGYRYWVMDAKIEEVELINRALEIDIQPPGASPENSHAKKQVLTCSSQRPLYTSRTSTFRIPDLIKIVSS